MWESDEAALLPDLYYVSELSPRLRAGVGIYAPFGMGISCNDSWTGRYHSVESALRPLNVNPCPGMAFQ